MKRQPQSFDVTVEFEGKTYSASYSVSSKIVTLESDYGTTSTQVGGSTAQAVARMLFVEMLNGAKARGRLHI